MIRKPQEYIESLNDGRVTYYLGEQVPDVTKQPLLREVSIVPLWTGLWPMMRGTGI